MDANVLLTVAGLFQLVTGLLFSAEPGQFSPANYPLIYLWVPWLAPLFMTAGIGLLYVASHDGLSFRFKAAVMTIASLPFVVLAVNFAAVRVWTGLSSYSILTAALVAALWSARGDGPARRREVDLFNLSLAAMIAVSGAGFLFVPGAFAPMHYGVLKDWLPYLGATMLLLAVFLLRSELRVRQPGGKRAAMVLAGVSLLFLAYNFYAVGVWTGTALYGLFAAAALLAPAFHSWRGLATTHGAGDAGITRLNPIVAHTVESCSWLLTLFLVGMFSLQPLLNVGHLVQVAIAILFLAIFSLGWLRVARRFLRMETVLQVQISVLTAVFGYLMFVTGGLYSHFATLLLIPVFMAALTLIPAAPWISGGIAFFALVVDALRDIWGSSVRGYGAFSLIVFHTLPLMVGATVSWVVACRMRSYLESLAVTKEELEIKNALLQEMAMKDPVTGLFNHRYFQERLSEELSRAARTGRPLALAILDLDKFKKVNDTYGHQAGDAVLQQVASAVRALLRASDVLARYGGEEFALILPDTDLDAAWAIVDRLRREVAATDIRLSDGRTIRVTFSAGVSAFSGGDPRGQALLAAADEALYRAKARGRNRVERADGSSVALVEDSYHDAYHV